MEAIRLTIADSISRRYLHSRLAVCVVLALLCLLFVLLVWSLQPSFAMFAAISAFFAIALTAGLMRNPMGILTMRMQKRLAAFDFIFDPHGISVTRLDGEAQRFEAPQAELFYIPGPGGSDYYLQINGKDGKTGSYYVGNDYEELEPLGKLLAQSGALLKRERSEKEKAESPLKIRNNYWD